MAKVWVIEDDRDILLLLQLVLSKAGHEVKCLSEGYSIVDNQSYWPDLFIVDKGLNVIDGIAICKYLKIKKQTRHIPIVIISANDYAERALKAGANYFLSKPFDTATLLQVITSLLENRH